MNNENKIDLNIYEQLKEQLKYVDTRLVALMIVVFAIKDELIQDMKEERV